MSTRPHEYTSSLAQRALVCAFLAACGDDNPKSSDAGGGVTDAGSGGVGDAGSSQDARAPSADGSTNAVRDSGAEDAADAADSPDTGVVPKACDASHAPVVPALSLEAVIPASLGLQRMIYAAQAPGSDTWYLVQQTGFVRVFEGGALRTQPLLDVSAEVGSIGTSDERGLLSVAFAPDFADSQLFYIFITPPGTNADEVREYKLVNGAAALQKTLLKLPASASNHNGGTLQFGPDGFLYAGTGDGGAGCDSNQPDAPQDHKKLFGKIHRLDPKAAAPYGAAGNPYPDSPTVIHIGFRNPFRFSIDDISRSLIIGDVGQDSYEELDIVSLDSLGKNFGWAAYEGVERTCPGRDLGDQTDWQRPVFIADRRGNNACATPTFCDWQSVIGGAVYRGSAIPELEGSVIFGDYQGRRMVALTQCGDTTSDFTVINKICDPNVPNEACFENSDVAALTAVVRDHAGELYLVADTTKLLKIVPGR